MKPIVLITGAAGLIGQYMMKSASRWAPAWEARGLARRDVDLTDADGVRALMASLNPQAIIHCAALSRTKECEQDPARARRNNVEATARLAELAHDIPFIFLSSGEVFDGRRGWYVETDEARPINVYGQTKLEAERAVLANPNHTAVRIVLTAGASSGGDRSFVEDMSRAARSGGTLSLFADEYRCPLPAGVIGRALWELLAQHRPGLYHLGGQERLSRWEIGEALAPWYPELKDRLLSGSSKGYRGSPRPADLSLNCDKIQQLLSFPIPGFRSWLANRATGGADLWDYPLA
ncbi:MAG: SDR family oxidoreductase [Nitrospira sp.]|nr:SDR family oxidoreductase [Nitrospira sp.]